MKKFKLYFLAIASMLMMSGCLVNDEDLDSDIRNKFEQERNKQGRSRAPQMPSEAGDEDTEGIYGYGEDASCPAF